jgi:hypothetical protein
MTNNLLKLTPVLAELGKIAPNQINHQLILDVMTQIYTLAISVLPPKRSGYSYRSLLYVALYGVMTGLSDEIRNDDLNLMYQHLGVYFQRFRKRRFINGKKRRSIPDQSCMARFLKRITQLGRAEDFSNLLLLGHLLYQQKCEMIKSRVILIADYVEEPCQKDRQDPYCFGSKTGKYHHKTLTFSIVSGNLHQIIAIFKMKKNQPKRPFFDKIIGILKSYGFEIVYGLLDRGFYRKDLFTCLKNYHITLIMPGRNCAASKKKITNWLIGKSNRTGFYDLPLKYVKTHGWQTLRFGLVLVGKKGHTLDQVKRNYQSGKLTLAEASKQVFPLLFLFGNSHGLHTLKGCENYIRSLYRERWAIEIAFRESNLLGIADWIQNRDKRLLRFGMKCVAYNLWQVERLKLQQKNPNAESLTLNEFCGRLLKNRTNATTGREKLTISNRVFIVG